MNLGKAIKQIRVEQGFSQSELAKTVGVTQATLSHIESGKKRPNDSTLKKISKGLNVPVSILYIKGIEVTDIPKENRELYSRLFPVVESLITQLVTK